MPDAAGFTWDRAAPLARCEGETHAANMALYDYAGMGLGRSLRTLAARYVAQDGGSTEDQRHRVESARFRNLAKWSTVFAWTERVEAWDQGEAGRALKAQQSERLRVIRQNVKVLCALQGVAVDRLASIKSGDWKPSEVVGAIGTSVKLLAEAYGTDPTSTLLDKLAERLGGDRGERLAGFVADLLAEPEGADG